MTPEIYVLESAGNCFEPAQNIPFVLVFDGLGFVCMNSCVGLEG